MLNWLKENEFKVKEETYSRVIKVNEDRYLNFYMEYTTNTRIFTIYKLCGDYKLDSREIEIKLNTNINAFITKSIRYMRPYLIPIEYEIGLGDSYNYLTCVKDYNWLYNLNN